MWSRWRSLATWDGIMPLAVSTAPALCRIAFPKNDLAEMSAVVVLPLAAAVVRAALGARQIRARCHGATPIVRQIFMAMAILLLLLFEGTVAILTFTDDEPLSAWLFPVTFYLCYLGAIAIALAPQPAPVEEAMGTS